MSNEKEINIALFGKEWSSDEIKKEVEIFKYKGYKEVSLDKIKKILKDHPGDLEGIEHHITCYGTSVIYQEYDHRKSFILYNLEEE